MPVTPQPTVIPLTTATPLYWLITKFSGEVGADETFIGGKARNMHLANKARWITGTGMKDKTAVMGILERGDKVRTTVVSNRKKSAVAGGSQEAR